MDGESKKEIKWMGKRKKETNRWRSAKGIERVGKHKTKRMDGETQRESNG